jgi:hypothetical protein
MARTTAPSEDVLSSEVAEDNLQELEQEAAAESVEAPAPMLIDEYSGQGGSYTLDSSTGQRTLVQRTQHSDTPR